MVYRVPCKVIHAGPGAVVAEDRRPPGWGP
jgi:hypothetical protein